MHPGLAVTRCCAGLSSPLRRAFPAGSRPPDNPRAPAVACQAPPPWGRATVTSQEPERASPATVVAPQLLKGSGDGGRSGRVRLTPCLPDVGPEPTSVWYLETRTASPRRDQDGPESLGRTVLVSSPSKAARARSSAAQTAAAAR